MPKIIFWDVDTQVDFMDPNGKLYVEGAKDIVENVGRLTTLARDMHLQISGDVCDHVLEDDEISEHPDFRSTYPPHCIRGTPGQEKIAQTRALHPLWIENRPYTMKRLKEEVKAHRGEILLKKNRVDVFSQPNTNLLLEILRPRQVIVYGVALDVCVYYAVEGFLARGDIRTVVVRDATRGIDPERGERILRDWRTRGVEVVTTDEVVKRLTLSPRP
jgi:nicotinamidase/pyrazinamidase